MRGGKNLLKCVFFEHTQKIDPIIDKLSIFVENFQLLLLSCEETIPKI
jgi:hypothetical protein